MHGFTGDPGQLLPLGRYLNDRGLAVRAPLLAGHGAGRTRLGPTAWLGSVAGACRGCDVAIGFSLGGLFAVELARQRRVRAAVTINAPLVLHSPAWRLRRWLRDRERPGDIGPASPSAVAGLWWYLRRVRRRLHEVRSPVLVIQARSDLTVAPASAGIIYGRLGSREKELLLVEGGHLLPLEAGRERVFGAVYDFAVRHGGAGACERA